MREFRKSHRAIISLSRDYSQFQLPDVIICRVSSKVLPGSTDYFVSTPIFEGPLDLLLELIERAELDISTLSLARVTDQFLSYLHQLPIQNADELSGFLVVAARLIQIKSVSLLPRAPAVEKEVDEDIGEALIRQLIEYKKYKGIALLLENREKSGLRSYLRLNPPAIHLEQHIDLDDFNLNDLVELAQEVFNFNQSLMPLDEVVSLPRFSIRERIHDILQIIHGKKSIRFFILIEKRSKIEIVLTFLAVLELIKQNILEVSQDRTFADILICSNPDRIYKSEMEIEF